MDEPTGNIKITNEYGGEALEFGEIVIDTETKTIYIGDFPIESGESSG